MQKKDIRNPLTIVSCLLIKAARKADMLSKAGQDLIYSLMTTLNKAARDAMVKYDVHACTDVTGFGLIGHTYEMASGSDTEITLNVNDIDLIPEALELARMGILLSLIHI